MVNVEKEAVISGYKDERRVVVAYQIKIIKKLDRACGSPNSTFVRTDQNSENEPAESKYEIVFFGLSKTTLPYWKASTMAENDSKITISAASVTMSEPLPSARPMSAV